MNQKPLMITLRKYTKDDHVFGNRVGKEIYQKLLEIVESHPGQKVFEVSLAGIIATDSSFPRESIVSLAKQLRGERGFFLTGITSKDLIDNWSYAANAKDQPLVIWTGNSYELIGPTITSAARTLIEFVLSHGSVTASKVAQEHHISVQNASTKLKKLVNQGFILRSEEVAETGGVEYIYHSIK